MGFNMENKLKAIARKSAISDGIGFLLVFTFTLIIIFTGIYATTNTFYLTTMLYIFLFIVLISTLYVIKDLLFIKKSRFTYGKVIKIEKNDSEDSEVYQNFVIEYIDENVNKTCETTIYERFGDNISELENAIQNFYKEGQNLLEKKVPLLYITKEPEKTLAFLRMVNKYDEIHKLSFKNKQILERSEKCICIYCKKEFNFSEINNWILDDKQDPTAVCPFCGIDAVIPKIINNQEISGEDLNVLYDIYFA